MNTENETPLLLQFLFGEAAALVQEGASPRLLCWCQAMDDWLAERKERCAERTVRGSMTAWKRLLSRCAKTPWEITPADITEHIDWMQASGYAASTIKTEVGMLSLFYAWCAQYQIDPACGPAFNPAAGVPRPKVAAYRQTRVLSRAEVRALLAILKRDQSIIGQRDYAFFVARLTLGVALKKLQQLRWGQIEREADGVWLRWGTDEARSPCPPGVWAVVHAYLEAAGRIESIQAEDYIFAPLRDPLKSEARGQAGDWNAGRYLGIERLRANLKLYGRLAGIAEEKLTLPALRHTAVLLRLEAGDSLEQIQAFLGTEAPPRVTKAYLDHLPPLLADEIPPPDDIRPTGNLPPGDETHPGDDQRPPGDQRPADEQPPLPQRKPRRFKPGDGLTHGFYALKQPIEEVEAVLAEDLQGMQDEFVGLRELSRMLLVAQTEAKTDEQVVRLGEAYTQAAARINEISKAERQRGEHSEQDQAVDEFLTMIDNVWALEDKEEDDDGELPSEDFWRMFAEADPKMGAASTRLTEEIASIRLVLRRLYDLAMQTEDAKALVRYTEKYGQGCIRLAQLLKSEKGVQGRAADMIGEIIEEVILEVNKEFGLELGG